MAVFRNYGNESVKNIGKNGKIPKLSGYFLKSAIDYQKQICYNLLQILEIDLFFQVKGSEFVIKRIVSVLLAIVLTALLIPAPTSVAATEAAEIENQIRATYKAARRGSGKYSFNGFCGSLVNWQNYILGIDDHVIGCDGKDEFDKYTAMGTTTGGYRVRSYPAGQYTLESALNTITANGTMDAYNILVGFQRTNTREGSIYGHALLIHAILGGTVYFMECFTTSINGVYYQEGAPISCSIETFCEYYNRWTVFDGIAYFGVKSYADLCTEYSVADYAMAKEDLTLYAEPFDEGVNQAKTLDATLVAGEKVKVSSVLQTPGGEFWYRLCAGSREGYVSASKLVTVAQCDSNLILTDAKLPQAVRRGAGFALRGTVSTGVGRIKSLEVIVYSEEKGVHEPEFSGKLETDSVSVSLSEPLLDRYMTFRNLKAGSYCLTIVAEVESNSFVDGKVTAHRQTEEVFTSRFQIITGWNQYPNITFDGNGGDPVVDVVTVTKGDIMPQLPEAQRDRYTFAGWSYDPAGKQMVDPTAVVEENITLYAQWKKGVALVNGWQQTENGWCYYENGAPAQGWFEDGGVKFYQNEGKPAFGWKNVDGVEYCFNKAGALTSGWQDVAGKRYYVSADGTKTFGWLKDGDGDYYFGADGSMQTQWVSVEGNWYYLRDCGCMAIGSCHIEGADCLFREDGVLLFAQQLNNDGGYYVVYDRQAASEYISPDQLLLLG